MPVITVSWMKRLMLAGIILLLLFSATALNAESLSPSTGDVYGTVVDEYDRPVNSILVKLEFNDTIIDQTVTNSAGVFQFMDLQPGEYTLIAVYSGTNTTRDVTVIVNQTASVEIQIYVLEPPPGDDDDDDDSDAESGANLIICFIPLFLIGVVIFLVIIVVSWQYSKITSDKLMNNETRQKIYDHINENPGEHLRGIKRDLSLPMGVLTHHITMMEREELLRARWEGKYKRYYTEKQKISKAPLMTGAQKKIVAYLRFSPGASPQDIAKELDKSPKTVYYHLTELESKGVVYLNKDEKPLKVYLAQDT